MTIDKDEIKRHVALARMALDKIEKGENATRDLEYQAKELNWEMTKEGV